MVLIGVSGLACAKGDGATGPAPPSAVDITGRWAGGVSFSSYSFALSQVGDTVNGTGVKIFSVDMNGFVANDTSRLVVVGGVHGTAVELTYWPESFRQRTTLLVAEASGDVLAGREYSFPGSVFLPLTLRREP